MSSEQTMYRVVFLQEDKVYEVYARYLTEESLMGFIEIEELVHHEARNVFLTVQSFSTTITSYAISTRATFPFVSLPHFEVRGTELNDLSNSILLAYAPYVSSDLLFRWGIYSDYMQNWIQEGVDYNYELHEDYLNGSHVLDPIFPQAWKCCCS